MALSITLAGKTTTPSSSTATTTTTNKSADLTLIRGVVSDVLANKANAITYKADAAAQRTTAAGYDAEIASYNAAGLTATQNAAYTKAAGDILEIQNKQEVQRNVGKTSAALAGSGFSSDTGSSVDQVRSSLQQGYLADQLYRTQSLFEQAGYLEEAAASKSETAAARTAKASALDTAGIYDDAVSTAETYATNATAGLSSYLKKFKLKTTADDLLSGKNIGTEIATGPKVTATDTKGTSTTGTPEFSADSSKLGSLSGYWKGATYSDPETSSIASNAKTGLFRDLYTEKT